MHSASCPFKVNLSLWPSISSSICLSSKNTCDTAVLESFEGTKNCHVNIILIRNDYVDLCHLSQRPKKQTSFRQIQDSCDWHIHTYMQRRHSNLGHRAMGQVVFLPRPESWGAFWAVITHNIGLPRSGTGLILARNGALEYVVCTYLKDRIITKLYIKQLQTKY